MPEPSRAAGLAQLAVFLPRAGRAYAEWRNFDPGPGGAPAVSALSPYLSHRLLTEPEVIAAVLTRHRAAEAEKFIQEVCWRSYWKGWLELRPGLWPAYRARLAAAQRDAEVTGRLRPALEARTGIACFDAWMRALCETGWLHNHARMWFASIWCFTLGLPWVLGADLFLRHLLDGDAASNTLSWRWVVGSQTPGKHYLARAENIARYTGGRFDPRGLLHETHPPILEPNPPPGLLPEAAGHGAEPWAGRAFGLLLHEHDLAIESLDLGGRTPRAIAGFAVPEARSPFGVDERVRCWTRAAVADGLARAAARHGRPAELLAPAAIAAWAAKARLSALVTPWAPVGWVADQLVPIEQALAAQGIPLIRLRRAWDSTTWPAAQRGFFQFRDRIPDLIGEFCQSHG
ncbi:FAD-binding domain-containing protein [Acidisoma sp. C75]